MGVDAINYKRAETRIQIFTLGLGALAAIVAVFQWSLRHALGVCLGCFIGWLNFRWLKMVVNRMTSLVHPQPGADEPRVPQGIYARVVGRAILFVAALCAIFFFTFLPGASVLAGLFALVAAVLLEMIVELIVGFRQGGEI